MQKTQFKKIALSGFILVFVLQLYSEYLNHIVGQAIEFEAPQNLKKVLTINEAWQKVDLNLTHLSYYLGPDFLSCTGSEKKILACQYSLYQFGQSCQNKSTHHGIEKWALVELKKNQISYNEPAQKVKSNNSNNSNNVKALTYKQKNKDRNKLKQLSKKNIKMLNKKIATQIKYDFNKSYQECPENLKSVSVAKAINAFLSVSKDPHTYIVPLEYFDKVMTQEVLTEGGYFGLQFRLSKNMEWAVYNHIRPSPEPPNEQNNKIINEQDILISLNGVISKNITVHYIKSQLYEYKKMHLTLRSHQTGHLYQVVLNPFVRSQKNVTWSWVDTSSLRSKKADFTTQATEGVVVTHGSIGEAAILQNQRGALLPKVAQIRIKKFVKNTCQDVQSALEQINIQGDSQALLLDLRANPGGSVDEAHCVLSLFVEPDQLVFSTYGFKSDIESNYFSQAKPIIYKNKMAVLVDQASASASEILAGSLKSLGRALIVGQRTFGKGTFQDGQIWPAHPKVALFETQGYYFFPNGESSQLVGVLPTQSFELAQSSQWLREEDLYGFTLPYPTQVGKKIKQKNLNIFESLNQFKLFLKTAQNIQRNGHFLTGRASGGASGGAVIGAVNGETSGAGGDANRDLVNSLVNSLQNDLENKCKDLQKNVQLFNRAEDLATQGLFCLSEPYVFKNLAEGLSRGP